MKSIFLRNQLRFLIVLVVCTIVFVLLLDKVIMPLYTRHGNEVVLLDVQKMDIERARAILRTNRFQIEVTDSVENPNMPPGIVIDQQPPPGSRVKRGRIVRLVITRGIREFPMPNLVGMALAAARLDLERNNVSIDSLIYQFSSDKPEGVIAGQSIPVDSLVKPHTGLTLTVSKGPPPHQLEVPDLFGLNLDEAKRVIRRAGFTLGTIRYIPSLDLTPFTVIGQYPEYGTLWDNPITVDLEVTTTELEE